LARLAGIVTIKPVLQGSTRFKVIEAVGTFESRDAVIVIGYVPWLAGNAPLITRFPEVPEYGKVSQAGWELRVNVGFYVQSGNFVT
jgi:hypothetical protein